MTQELPVDWYWTVLDRVQGLLVVVSAFAGLLYLIHRRRRSKPNTSTEEAQVQSVRVRDVHGEEEGNTATVPDIHSSQLVEWIDRVPEGYAESASIAATAGFSRAVQPLLQQLPASVAAGSAASGTYVLRFSPETTRMLHEGSASLMKAVNGSGDRAIAVAKDGIREHGTLTRQGPVKALGALAIWQVLSIVTAQRYLASIDEKLAKLSTAVEGIRTWLEEDRHGRLVASIEWMQDWATRARDGALHEIDIIAVDSQLERIEVECRQDINRANSLLAGCTARLGQLRLTGAGLMSHHRNAAELVGEAERQIGVALTANFVRAASAQLRAGLPLDSRVARDRLASVSRDLRRQSEAIDDLHKLVLARHRELRGRFSFRSTDRRLQRQFLDQTKATAARGCALAEEVSALAESFGRVLASELDKPDHGTVLALRVVNGEVTSATVHEPGVSVRVDTPQSELRDIPHRQREPERGFADGI